MAGRLLARFEELHGAISALPVPVERLVEDFLDLGISLGAGRRTSGSDDTGSPDPPRAGDRAQ